VVDDEDQPHRTHRTGSAFEAALLETSGLDEGSYSYRHEGKRLGPHDARFPSPTRQRRNKCERHLIFGRFVYAALTWAKDMPATDLDHRTFWQCRSCTCTNTKRRPSRFWTIQTAVKKSFLSSNTSTRKIPLEGLSMARLGLWEVK
jgi:hypothetical protein